MLSTDVCARLSDGSACLVYSLDFDILYLSNIESCCCFFQQELYLLLECSLDPVLSDDPKCWLVSRMNKLECHCVCFVRREVMSFGSLKNLLRLHQCAKMATLVWLLNI